MSINIDSDLTGLKFNRLTVVKKDGDKSKGYWHCVCECGKHKSVNWWHLANSYIGSCGCLRLESRSEINKTHGKSKSRVYITWINMKNRCLKPTSKDYQNYGGRGIKVCDEWSYSFENFYRDMGEQPDGMTIDRINVNGNYEKDNCRWATPKQQCRNRTNSLIVEYNGVKKTLIEHCEDVGMPYKSVFRRIGLGWSIEKELTKPLRESKQNVSI